MANCAIVGINWGDEGKGRMVDLISQEYDIVARYQGGGFAGTIQAYVPQSLLERYHSEIERVFGKGSCYILRLREQGAVKVI